MVNDTEPIKDSSLSSWLRSAVFLLAIYSYFAGWIYTYYLYAHFGLSLNAIEIPPYFFFVYAYFAVPSFSLVNLAAATLVGAVVVPLLYVGTRPRLRWIAGVVLFLVFPLLAHIAKEQASTTSARIRAEQTTSVSFIFKKDTLTKFPADLLARNQQGLLRLLTETKDRFYVLHQNTSGSSDLPLPIAYVYSIAKSDVLLATIEIQNIRRPTP